MPAIFFYGLFMDPQVLEEKECHPVNVTRACLPGYQLKIGERATLLASPGSRCYGTVIELADSEVRKLYQDESVKDYKPLDVEAVYMDGGAIQAVSYVLPVEKLSGSNSEYAKSLARVAMKLELPDEYVAEIEQWI